MESKEVAALWIVGNLQVVDELDVVLELDEGI